MLQKKGKEKQIEYWMKGQDTKSRKRKEIFVILKENMKIKETDERCWRRRKLKKEVKEKR